MAPKPSSSEAPTHIPPMDFPHLSSPTSPQKTVSDTSEPNFSTMMSFLKRIYINMNNHLELLQSNLTIHLEAQQASLARRFMAQHADIQILQLQQAKTLKKLES